MEMRPEALEHLDLTSLEYDPVFPALFKYYNSNALGRCIISNSEESKITDLEVTIYVNQYMVKTIVSAEFAVSGTLDGKKFENKFIRSISLLDRNTITWEDDRRAAAFVTL
jgi:hypothetical protein